MTTTEPKKIGRPRLTDPEQLLAAARRIGFRDLSIGAVTRAVGVKYSTFYRSYLNHSALVGALLDQVLAEQPWPVTGTEWRQHLDELTETLATVARDWPGLADAIRPLLATDGEPERLRTARSVAELDLVGAGMRGGHAETAVHTVIQLALDDRPNRDGIDLVLDGLAVRRNPS